MVLFFVLTHCNCICVQDTLVYSLVPKEPETSFFFLHPATGVITLAKRLTVEGDAERKTEYRVNRQVLLILINLTLFNNAAHYYYWTNDSFTLPETDSDSDSFPTQKKGVMI